MVEHRKPELSIADLQFDPRNARKRTERSASRIARSLEKLGAARSIVIDENNTILAGNGTVEAAGQVGIERVQVVDVDGDTIVAVRRTGLTEQQKIELAIADNRTAELSEWDDVVLADLAEEYDLSDWFRPEELDEVLGGSEPWDEPEPDDADEATQIDGDRYALAIVLSFPDYQRWKAVKANLGISRDVNAFLKLLEDAEAADV